MPQIGTFAILIIEPDWPEVLVLVKKLPLVLDCEKKKQVLGALELSSSSVVFKE